MIRVNDTHNFEIVQIDIQGNDSLGYFDDVIKFIIQNDIDLGGDNHTSIYDICLEEIKSMNTGSQTITYAIAYVYDINGNLLNQFEVLD